MVTANRSQRHRAVLRSHWAPLAAKEREAQEAEGSVPHWVSRIHTTSDVKKQSLAVHRSHPNRSRAEGAMFRSDAKGGISSREGLELGKWTPKRGNLTRSPPSVHT